MSKLRKYKTSLYELHKGLDGIITKDNLEERIKGIAGFDKPSCTEATNEELDHLIIVVYMVADEMKVELKEDNEITFNW